MQPDSHRVKDIAQIDARTLGILWTDGKSDAFDVVELRRKCPCAVCIDEWTRVPKLKPEDVAVVYFDPSPEGVTTVKHLRISEDGEFLDRWPRGFFTERDGELFDE